jgi:ribonuclease D
VVSRFTVKGFLLLTEETSQDEPVVLPLRAESVAPVYYLDSEAELHGALASLRAGTGPLAIDAERASGFKYSSRAYLIQVHRSGTDVFLIDPIPLSKTEAWREFAELCNGIPWILHAATQDLTCLRELDLNPIELIDTELGSRILGLPRVGLGAACEQLLGFRLAKEHSAADWSIRPLPNSWLNYAALDVDVLPDLARVLLEQLEIAGKLDWAKQEFHSLLSFQPKPYNPDRWRSMTGLHDVKDPQRLAVARELWMARDELAVKLDVSPGRLVPDASVVALVKSKVSSRSELASLSSFNGRASRTYLDTWWEAYQKGLNARDLPPLKLPHSGIPNHRNWPNRFPEADARLQLLKPVMAELALEFEVPAENILQPDLMRRVAWEPESDIAQQLTSLGARKWQVEAVAGPFSAALATLTQD